MRLVSLQVVCHDERGVSMAWALLLLKYDACRVAQLFSEVHHIQQMRHRASKMYHGSWVCSTYEDSMTPVSSPPLQNTGRSVPPLGVGANAPASQTQLTPRQQMGRLLQIAGEQPSFEGDAEHAWGMVTARSRRPHAPNPSSVESNHNIQRPPDQRPALAARSSKRDMSMQPIDTGVTAQHSPKRLEATSAGIAMSKGTSGKSAKSTHLGHNSPVAFKGRTAGAHQQRSNRRTSAPVNTLSQLSASDLTHVPGHSDDQGSKCTSAAGNIAPHRSATLTRCRYVPCHRWCPAYRALHRDPCMPHYFRYYALALF